MVRKIHAPLLALSVALLLSLPLALESGSAYAQESNPVRNPIDLRLSGGTIKPLAMFEYLPHGVRECYALRDRTDANGVKRKRGTYWKEYFNYYNQDISHARYPKGKKGAWIEDFKNHNYKYEAFEIVYN